MERLDALATLVSDQRQQILDDWKRQLLIAIPARTNLDTPLLEDGVPNFLDELSNALLEARDLGAAPKRIEYGPATHGIQRFDLGSQIDELVIEYGALRNVILETAERHNIALEGQPRAILHQVVDGAIARAVREFSSMQEAEHERRVQDRMAMIVHDLKTPLAAIHTAIRLLDARLPPEPKQAVRTMIGIVARNCDSIDSMLMNLLERTSRDEMVLHAELHRGDCDFHALVQELIENIRPIAEKTTVSLINEVPQGFHIHVDAYLFKQAVQNLVSNALKYTSHGDIRVGGNQVGGYARIWVADTGIGMPAERVKRLFGRREVDPLKQGSTGLGLSIVKRVVDAHQGHIDVYSQPGKGTRFDIMVPKI